MKESNTLLYKIVMILSIISLILPAFSLAEGGAPQAPQTMAEAESLGMKILNALPSAINKVWQEEARPLLLKMWSWAKNIWDSYLASQVDSLWRKFLHLLGKESPDIKQEFQKEKQEMEQDFWQKFRELLP